MSSPQWHDCRHDRWRHGGRLVFVLIAAAAALAGPSSLAAQAAKSGGLNLAIEPLRMEYQVAAGASLTDAAHLANQSTQAVRMTATVNDWTLAEDGTPNFLAVGAAAPDAYACARWIHLNPDNFELDPGATERVRYTIEVPPGTPAMGCRAAILFTSAPPTVTRVQRQVLTRLRIATILYIRVGRPAAVGQLADLSLAPAAGGSAGVSPVAGAVARDAAASLGEARWELALRIGNAGSTYFRANGQAVIRDAAGREVKTFPIVSQVVLPGEPRVLRFDVGGLAAGTYHLSATLDAGGPSLERIEKTVVLAPAPTALPSNTKLAQLGHGR